MFYGYHKVAVNRSGKATIAVGDIINDIAFRVYKEARKRNAKLEELALRRDIDAIIRERYSVITLGIIRWWNSDSVVIKDGELHNGNMFWLDYPAECDFIECEIGKDKDGRAVNLSVPHFVLARAITEIEKIVRSLYGEDVVHGFVDNYPRWYGKGNEGVAHIGPRNSADDNIPSVTRNVRADVSVKVQMRFNRKAYIKVSEYVREDGKRVRIPGVFRPRLGFEPLVGEKIKISLGLGGTGGVTVPVKVAKKELPSIKIRL